MNKFTSYLTYVPIIFNHLKRENVVIASGFIGGFMWNILDNNQRVITINSNTDVDGKHHDIKINSKTNYSTNNKLKRFLERPLSEIWSGCIAGLFTSFGVTLLYSLIPELIVPIIPLSIGASIAYYAIKND